MAAVLPATAQAAAASSSLVLEPSDLCLRSNFMLKFLAEALMVSQASEITMSYFMSSFGCGDSCILIIFRMQQGSFFERR